MARGECPDPQPYCKYHWDGGCYSDLHEDHWPANQYRTELEVAFRGLYQRQICRRLHEQEHEKPAPPKPEAIEMATEVASLTFPDPGSLRNRLIGILLDQHYAQAKQRYPKNK